MLPKRRRAVRRAVLVALDPEAETLTVEQARRVSGLGRHYLYTHLATRPGGWIPVLNVDDNRVRIPRRAFLDALAKRTVTEAPEATATRVAR